MNGGMKALFVPVVVATLVCAAVLPARYASGGGQAMLAPGWDIAMRAGNRAAMRGDIEEALHHWSTLHRYTKDRCMLVYAGITVDAAKRTLHDIRVHNLARERRYARYFYYSEERWRGNTCNR
jgi:hypothetical protein